MSNQQHEYANALLVMQYKLEQTIVNAIRDFEKSSGMRVHSMKIFSGEAVNGKRLCANVEVSAQLR